MGEAGWMNGCMVCPVELVSFGGRWGWLACSMFAWMDWYGWIGMDGLIVWLVGFRD